MTLWANLHLLFWLSLVPFVTEWMGQSHFGDLADGGVRGGLVDVRHRLGHRAPRVARITTANPCWSKALGGNLKEWASAAIYVLAIGLAFVNTWVSCGLFTVWSP